MYHVCQVRNEAGELHTDQKMQSLFLIKKCWYSFQLSSNKYKLIGYEYQPKRVDCIDKLGHVLIGMHAHNIYLYSI